MSNKTYCSNLSHDTLQIPRVTINEISKKDEVTSMLKGQRFRDLLDIVTANSDDNVDDYLELLQPDQSNRYEMGAKFESTIGYDPITYYDRRELERMVDALIESKVSKNDTEKNPVPEWLKEALKDEKNRIDLINKAMDIYDSCRDDLFLPNALMNAIELTYNVEVNIEAKREGDIIKAIGEIDPNSSGVDESEDDDDEEVDTDEDDDEEDEDEDNFDEYEEEDEDE